MSIYKINRAQNTHITGSIISRLYYTIRKARIIFDKRNQRFFRILLIPKHLDKSGFDKVVKVRKLLLTYCNDVGSF